MPSPLYWGIRPLGLGKSQSLKGQDQGERESQSLADVYEHVDGRSYVFDGCLGSHGCQGSRR